MKGYIYSLSCLAASLLATAAFAAYSETNEAAAASADAASSGAKIAEGTVREAMLNGRKVKMQYENGNWYVLGKTRGGVSTNDVASVHKPDDLFLEINGDRLDWSVVDEQIEMRMNISPLKIPHVATAEDIAVVMATERRKHAQLLLDGYIENALLAHEARKCGYTVSNEEVLAVMETAMRGVPRAKREAYLAKVSNPGTYFFRNQANFVLGAKYRDGVLAKGIEVSAGEIAEAKKERDGEIAEAEARDAGLKPAMEAFLKGLRDGSLDFEETAFDESDTPDEEGGVWGEFERADMDDDDQEFTREMQDFAFSAPRDALGGVFEAEGCYVILKVLKTDAKDGAQAENVTLARIVKERIDIPEPFDDESARKLVWRRKLAQKIAQTQERALAEASIRSALPTQILKRVRGRAAGRRAGRRREKRGEKKNEGLVSKEKQEGSN